MSAISSEPFLNRIHGAFLGSALGDSIGLYTEFLSPQDALKAYPSKTFSLIEPVTPLLHDTHRSRFEPRSFTDDTDHTIIMMLSFLRNGKLIPNDFAIRLRYWCEHGLRCLNRDATDIGVTVGRVVFDKAFRSNPAEAARSYWEKTGRYIAPNGSLMRTTPVGVICFNKSEEVTFQEAIEMGAVTHADPRCAVSVAAVSALVRALCRGEVSSEADVDTILERAFSFTVNYYPDYPPTKEEFSKHVYATSLHSLLLHDGGMGFVYKCLGSSIWCLRQVLRKRETFKSATVKLIMEGGDADTNAAVAGALMGAYCGYDKLPREWREGMKHEKWLRHKVDALSIVAGLTDAPYDPQDDKDTELDDGVLERLKEEDEV